MIADYQKLLKNKNFLFLWSSQILSQLTINLINFLLLIKLFQDTQSSIATSFLWVSYAIPAILFGPVAAVSVDLVDRRRVLMLTNFFQGLTILAFAFLHPASTFLLYGVVLGYSFLNQFYTPAEISSLPAVVAEQNLPQANGLFFITQQVAIVFGFGVAGLILGFMGFFNSLILCSALLFAAFVSVYFLPKMKAEPVTEQKVEDRFVEFFKRIYEGYKFIRDNRLILGPFLMLLGVQIAMYIIALNTPIIATEILGVSAELSGIAVVAPAGIGTALGALVIPKWLKKGKRKYEVVKTSFMGLVACFFALIFLSLFLSKLYLLIVSFLLIILVGLGFVGIFIPTQTFLQEKTPAGLQGRVFGNYWFLVAVATLIPVIISGTIVELFGIRFLLFLVTAVSFFALILINKTGNSFLRKNKDFTLAGDYKNGR